MAEPSSAGIGLAALAVALLGPLAGPYALIVFASLAGALWPLAMADIDTRRKGVMLLLRCTTVSVIFTGTIATFITGKWGIAPDVTIAPVSFLIASIGNGWKPILAGLSAALAALANKYGAKKADDDRANS